MATQEQPTILNSAAREPRRVFKKELTFKFLILGIVFVFAAGGMVYFSKALSKEVVRVKEFRAENKWILENFEIIAQVSSNMARAKELEKSLKLYLPTALDVPVKFVPELKIIMNVHKITSPLIELGGESVLDDRSVFDLSLHGEGTLSDILAFMDTFENQKPVVRIQNMIFSRVIQGRYQMSAAVSVFTQENL